MIEVFKFVVIFALIMGLLIALFRCILKKFDIRLVKDSKKIDTSKLKEHLSHKK